MAAAELGQADTFYTPATIERLLLASHALIKDGRQIANPGTGPTNPSNPQGGFESGVSILVDLFTALDQLDPFVRDVISRSYVEGFFVFEVAEQLHCRKVRVRQAKEDGILEMAHVLGWRGEDDRLLHQQQRERWRLEVANDLARLLDYCPRRGDPMDTCVVCGAGYDEDGSHLGALHGRSA